MKNNKNDIIRQINELYKEFKIEEKTNKEKAKLIAAKLTILCYKIESITNSEKRNKNVR